MFGEAAKLSYYFLLALFPLLIFLTTLLGYSANAGGPLYNSLLTYLRPVLPLAAFELVVNTLVEIHKGAGGGKLSIGIVATLWAASNGIKAMKDVLNKAYQVREGRPWWKAQLIAVALTVALSFFIIVALALVLYGNELAEFIAGLFGLGGVFSSVWEVLQWPVGIVFVLAAVMLFYRFGPDLRGLTFSHTIPERWLP